MVALTCALVSAPAHAQRTKRPSPVRDSLTTSRVIIQLTPDLAANLDSLAKSAAIALRRSNEPAAAGGLTTITKVLGAIATLIGIAAAVRAFFTKEGGQKAALAAVSVLAFSFLLVAVALLLGAIMLPAGVLLLSLSVLLLSMAAWGFLLLAIWRDPDLRTHFFR